MSAGREGFPEEREKPRSKKEQQDSDRFASKSSLQRGNFLSAEPRQREYSIITLAKFCRVDFSPLL